MEEKSIRAALQCLAPPALRQRLHRFRPRCCARSAGRDDSTETREVHGCKHITAGMPL